MSAWLVAVIVGIAFGALQYGRELRSGAGAVAAAALRTLAVLILMALVLDAPLGPGRRVRPWVALDDSQSWTRGHASRGWVEARDALRQIRPDSLFLFGSRLRAVAASSGGAAGSASPEEPSSFVRPAVDRALGRGHPLVVVTDGELDDPDALRLLPTGSRVEVIPNPPQRDAAVTSLDVSRALVSGDTVEARVGLGAGGLGAGRGVVSLLLNGKSLVSAPLDSMPAWSERVLTLRVRVQAPEGHAVLAAVVSSAADVEPRNDTLSVGVDVSRAAGAVFVSTSPDLDARYSLAVLRGALSIPTRGFFRVAPGAWRADGSLSAVAESDIRQAVRDAPVVILHGDTAMFGPPASITRSPLALLVPPSTDEGEWYPTAAPTSPLQPALSGLPWDSLAPLDVAPVPPKGQWQGLLAKRGREGDARVAIAGTDAPRRVVVAASGWWRWRFRGGVESDAFTALWGSIFDWLAAERADRRAAVPDERLVRAGEPVRWRRGSPADSVAVVVLRRRGGPARVDTLTLRFPGDASVVDGGALAPGIYDATMRGGSAVLAVNASRELIPRAPRVKSGDVGGTPPVDSAPRARVAWWLYALAILLLCAEWIVRRRTGMR